MADNGESKEQGAFTAWAYAPPPEVVDTDTPVLMNFDGPVMPIWLTVAYSVIATAITFGCIFFAGFFDTDFGEQLFFVVPYLLISGFVGICFLILDRGLPLPGRSLAWKVFLVFAVPPTSMICFVPTCIGSVFVVFPVLAISGVFGTWAICIPVLIAYLVTFRVIAYRLRKKLLTRPRSSIAAPFSDLAPTFGSEGSFSSTFESKPQRL